MKFQAFAILALGVLAMCFADVAEAQSGQIQQRGGLNGFADFSLIMNGSVREELKLSEDQVDQVNELRTRMRVLMRKMYLPFRIMSEEEREEFRADLQAETEKLLEELPGELDGILLEDQMSRFKQIQFQNSARRNGGGAEGAFQNEKLAELLGITKDQQKELKEKTAKVKKDLKEKESKLREEAEEKILSVLTSEQRKKYKELMGESFEFNNNRGGRGDLGGFADFSLIMNGSVREELKLTEDQVDQLNELRTRMRDDMRKMYGPSREMRGMSEEEREELRAAIGTKPEELLEELTGELDGILLEDQMSRFKQIQFQNSARRNGGGAEGAFQNEKLAELLGITEDQQKELKEKTAKVKKDLKEKESKLREEAEEKILSVLTSEQRKKYKELMGDSFEFDQRGRRGDRGERGGRRGNRGGGDDGGKQEF